MQPEEYLQLCKKAIKGSLSKKEKKRLYDFIREDSSIPMPDHQIDLMLAVSDDNYGKPDKNGEIRTV